jgi:hypothetical protein
MLRKIFWLVVLGIILFFGYSAVRHFLSAKKSPAEQQIPIVQRTIIPPPPFSMVLAQTDSNSGATHLLNCPTTNCHLMVPPPEAVESVTNGDSWFFYTDETDPKQKNNVRILKRQDADGKLQVISSQTPLVRPRDLYLSPDGAKVAFWLDNIDDPTAALTELWVYDSQTRGARVVAENVHLPDVLSTPRWNAASTTIWFLGNTAAKKQDKHVELLAATVDPPAIQAHFSRIDWSGLSQVADRGIMDISRDGTAVAYVYSLPGGEGALHIAAGDSPLDITTLRGQVPYIQWLEDGSLLYAVQDSRGFSFWRVRNGVHQYVTRQNGTLVAASSDARAEYVSFITSSLVSQQRSVLQLSSGTVTSIGTIPIFGDHVAIAHVAPEPLNDNPAVAGITSALDDGQLLAFVEEHIAEISGQAGSSAKKIIMTNQANTVYVDYGVGDAVSQRLLVSIRDAIHPEWIVVGRYQAINVGWQKVFGGGLKDPDPTKLYEWEPSVGKWIFKQSY